MEELNEKNSDNLKKVSNLKIGDIIYFEYKSIGN